MAPGLVPGTVTVRRSNGERGIAMGEPVSDGLLAKVRGLLAKAEDPAATQAEAEAYAAKAMEIMAKYGIEQAMVDATRTGERETVADRIILVHAPYAYEKGAILNRVGKPFGVRTIRRWGRGNGTREYHLFGFTGDLERTELLFTSLLIQANRFMASAKVPRYVTPVTFRRDWMMGYADEIGKRLQVIVDHAAAQTEAERTDTGPSVALVLVDRSMLVSKAVSDTYPKLSRSRSRAVGDGYWVGQADGRRADLGQAGLNRQGATRAAIK